MKRLGSANLLFSLLFGLALVAIVINIAQFENIRNHSKGEGKRWGLYRLSNPDPFSQPIIQKYKFYTRSNVFNELGWRVPDSIIYISKSNPFLKDSDFMSKLRIFGQTKQIVVIDDNDKLSAAAAADKQYLAARGDIRITSGRQINGVAVVQWAIYYKQQTAKEFVLVTNPKYSQWQFVDKALLGKDLIKVAS